MSVSSLPGSEQAILATAVYNSPSTPPSEKELYEARQLIRVLTRNPVAVKGNTYKVDKRLWACVGFALSQNDKLQYTYIIFLVTWSLVMLILKHSLDYYPQYERLSVRMPKRLHDLFIQRLSQRIHEQLTRISGGTGPASDFAKNIENMGSSTVKPRDPEYGTHDPDISFQHPQSASPTVIIEIANTQLGKHLPLLAEDYILGSNLAIRVVVGVNINYRKSKRATFTVWRASSIQDPVNGQVWTVEPTVENQIFRDDDGRSYHDQEARLQLHLEDFADPITCEKYDDLNKDVTISCHELFQDLQRVENVLERMELANSQSQPRPRPRLQKRRRPQTPEETLNEHDEAS